MYVALNNTYFLPESMFREAIYQSNEVAVLLLGFEAFLLC